MVFPMSDYKVLLCLVFGRPDGIDHDFETPRGRVLPGIRNRVGLRVFATAKSRKDEERLRNFDTSRDSNGIQ